MQDVLEFFDKEFGKCQTLSELQARYCELYDETRDWADNDQERLELLRTRLEEAFEPRYMQLQSEQGAKT